MTKKSYKPWKMWGSWVGVFLGILLSYLSIKFFLYDLIDMKIAFESYLCGGIQECINYMIDIPAFIQIQYISYAVFGFFIGWGIHSLFRRFKK